MRPDATSVRGLELLVRREATLATRPPLSCIRPSDTSVRGLKLLVRREATLATRPPLSHTCHFVRVRALALDLLQRREKRRLFFDCGYRH